MAVFNVLTIQFLEFKGGPLAYKSASIQVAISPPKNPQRVANGERYLLLFQRFTYTTCWRHVRAVSYVHKLTQNQQNHSLRSENSSQRATEIRPPARGADLGFQVVWLVSGAGSD